MVLTLLIDQLQGLYVKIQDGIELPTTMTAAVLTGRGGPEVLEVRHDVAVPTPADDEVLIRVAACGMNNTDINTRVGWYSKSVTGATAADGFDEAEADDATWGGSGLTYPRIQGADPSGRIVAVGDDVDASMLGRRAMVDPWIRPVDDPTDRSRAGYFGSEMDGGFAQFCVAPARNVLVHNSDLSDVELASFPCSWSTAEHMLQRVDLSAGQSVAVTGASGGVGTALIALAKRRGARVVAIAGGSKRAAVESLGPDAFVDRSDDDLYGAAEAANGGPFNVVADVVGGDGMGAWLDSLKRGGRYVTAGAIAGPMVEIDLRTLYLNDLELYGATVFQQSVFSDLLGYITGGEIQPVVGPVFPLEEIHKAQEVFVAKQHVGTMVLTVS